MPKRRWNDSSTELSPSHWSHRFNGTKPASVKNMNYLIRFDTAVSSHSSFALCKSCDLCTHLYPGEVRLPQVFYLGTCSSPYTLFLSAYCMYVNSDSPDIFILQWQYSFKSASGSKCILLQVVGRSDEIHLLVRCNGLMRETMSKTIDLNQKVKFLTKNHTQFCANFLPIIVVIVIAWNRSWSCHGSISRRIFPILSPSLMMLMGTGSEMREKI